MRKAVLLCLICILTIAASSCVMKSVSSDMAAGVSETTLHSLSNTPISDTTQTSSSITAAELTTDSGIYTPTAPPITTPALTPSATEDPISFYIEFDVQKYDYTFIDENHYSLWTKKDWFAYAMRRMQQDVEYSLNGVIVSFTNNYKEFDDPDLLKQKGLILNGRINQYGDQDKYWTVVELINKSKDGVRNAIIQLNQDNNAGHVKLNIIVPLID